MSHRLFAATAKIKSASFPERPAAMDPGGDGQDETYFSRLAC
jgi:hypothetical protein